MLWDEVNTSYSSDLCGKDPEDLIIEVRGLLFSMLVCLQAMWLACYEFPERCLCYLLLAVAWGPQSVKADFTRSKKAWFLWQREASPQGEAETAQLKSGPQVPS